MVVNYSCIYLVSYIHFGSCKLIILKNLGDQWVASILDPHLRRRCTKSKKSLVIAIRNSHGLAWAKWITIIIVFHNTWQSLTVLPFSCTYIALVQESMNWLSWSKQQYITCQRLPLPKKNNKKNKTRLRIWKWYPCDVPFWR